MLMEEDACTTQWECVLLSVSAHVDTEVDMFLMFMI